MTLNQSISLKYNNKCLTSTREEAMSVAKTYAKKNKVTTSVRHEPSYGSYDVQYGLWVVETK